MTCRLYFIVDNLNFMIHMFFMTSYSLLLLLLLIWLFTALDQNQKLPLKQSIMVQAKTWILTKHFDGFPKDSDFELKVEELPEPKDGGRIIF